MIFHSPFPAISIPDVPLVPFVLEHARALGAKPALIDGASGRVLTYAELHDAVQRTAAGLSARGLAKGDVFAILSPNAIEYALAFHGVAHAGGVVTTINPLSTAEEIAHQLAGLKKYFMATLNNEVMELNLYRIQHFDLRKYFSVFFSSCFLGLRKPDEAIYRAVLNILQREADECIFIDDREVNLECPSELGLRTIHFQNAVQLRRELEENGVDFQG